MHPEVRQTSLGDALRCVSPALEKLIRQSYSATMALADAIPAGIVSLFGFESRLDSDDPVSDFLFAANIATGGRDYLRHATPLSEGDDRRPWQSIAAFCEKWADPANILFTGADDVWFEFDVSSGGPKSRTPSFFFGPRVGLNSGENPIRKTSRILQEGLAILRGAPLPGALLERLDRVLEILPAHARIFQAGLMLSRPDSPIRICVDNLSAAELMECVRKHLGTECEETVAAAIEPIQGSLLSLKPSFDIGEQAANRVGLECYAASPQREWNPSSWHPMLEHLTETGLSTRSRADVLLEIPPFVYPDSTHANDGGTLLAALAGQEWAYSLKLHHIKLTVQSLAAPSAKSYLAVQKVWLT